MINDHACREALRERAEDAVLLTTGEISLEATTTGYTRSSGSFLDDITIPFKTDEPVRLWPGMEITPTGFSANTVQVIQSVADDEIVVIGGRTAEASNSGRSITVKIPYSRTWDAPTFKPVAGRDYIEDEFDGLPGRKVTGGQGGQMNESALYHLRWHGQLQALDDALLTTMTALKFWFASGTEFDVANTEMYVSYGPPTPSVSRPIPDQAGRSISILTVPLFVRTRNFVAA